LFCFQERRPFPTGSSCKLMKLDVEGFEMRVLKGAEQTIAEHRPVLFIENDKYSSYLTLLSWLSDHKYKVKGIVLFC
jgi:hypothetical protein